MKKKLLFSVVALVFGVTQLIAQCTPQNATTCPDPENNGQICPDSLAPGFVGVPYSQTVTILPPPSVNYGGNPIPMNKIVIQQISNLSPGITWVSNQPNNSFPAGVYSCILLSGTPTQTGVYPLKITVDAYITFMGQPVLAATQTDSTSVIMTIGTAGMNEKNSLFTLIGNYGNEMIVNAYSEFSLKREIIDVLGCIKCQETFQILPGANVLPPPQPAIKSGFYFVRFSAFNTVITRKFYLTE